MKACKTEKILIGTVTRGRPKMLRRLLNSYSALQIPLHLDVHYIVAENNSDKTLDDTIENFRSLVPDNQVYYVLEENIGIPHIRNKVLQHAIDNHYDVLIFADDDQVVDKSWLISLLEEYQSRDLDLVGSPVRVGPAVVTANWWHLFIWKAIRDINLKAENRCLRKKLRGKDGGLRIATGSWLGRVDFFKNSAIRFDTSLGLAGGEDWLLYEECKRHGARTGWAPSAIAYETIPISRLSLGYYYRRNRDHARMMFLNRIEDGPARVLVRLSGSLASRVYKLFLSILRMPFNPGRNLIACVYYVGSSVGLIQGCFGKRSDHYRNVDGY